MKSIRIIFLCILTLAACKQPAEHSAVEQKVYNVKVQSPEFIKYSEPLRASGILSTRLEVKLGFKTGGLIKTMNVREGQTVNAGDVLASLDLSEINAHVNQAGIACEKAKRDYTRAQNLYRDSVATLEMVQNAKSAYDLSLSQKKIAEFNLKHSRIIAPAKGKIQKIIAKQDEIIAPGYPAILFATSENNWIVRVALSDKDIVKFQVGDSASIEMDPYPDKLYSAVISELGTFADPVTGTYEVELLMEEENLSFRPGFVARAQLFPSEVSAGWWLPLEAVQNVDNNRGYVFILDGPDVVKRNVKVGKIVNEGLLILDGLSDDLFVVTDGASYLKDGARVNVLSFEKEL